MRHSHGYGLVEDEAEARPAAYVDINSKVIGRARAHSGQLINSTLAIESRLHNATVISSLIACDEVTGGKIVDSQLYDQCVVWDAPTLYRVEAHEGVRIYGNAVMLGPMVLRGDLRVLAGTWHRAPLYRHLGFCFMTEGPPNHAMVDCKFLSFAAWFRIGPRFAKRHYGWSASQVEEVRKVLIEWSENEDLSKKHWGKCVAGCSRLMPADYSSGADNRSRSA